jgi:hypothetical protein
MKIANYDPSLSIADNIQNDFFAKKLAKVSWGKKFRDLYSKHNTNDYYFHSTYDFTEGMKSCTQENGSPSEQIDELTVLIDELALLDDSSFFTVDGLFFTEYGSVVNVEISNWVFSIADTVFNGNMEYWLEECIIQKRLADMSDLFASVDVGVGTFKVFLEEEKIRLLSWSVENVRAVDDIELLNHLGLCGVLEDEIDKPYKIRKIFLKFLKPIAPPTVAGGDYDQNYKWWHESQFDEIREKIPNFQEFFYEENSWIFIESSFLTLSPSKIYEIVSFFMEIHVYAVKHTYQQIVSVGMLAIAVYLTVISNNPVWLKILLVAGILANSSGSLGSKAKLALTAVMFIYGNSTTTFTSMSGMEMFKWAIGNIDMIMKIVNQYENLQAQKEAQNVNDTESAHAHTQQYGAMEYMYGGKQYDHLYNETYNYEIEY